MAEKKKTVLTTIERLNAERPGLQLDVDLLFDAGKSAAQVQDFLLQKHHLEVPEKTISNYRIRRYLPARARVRGLIELRDALMDAVAKYKDGELLKAFMYERLGDALEAGEKVSLPILMREFREWGKQQLLADRNQIAAQKAATDRRRLEMEIERLQGEKKQVAAIVTEASRQAAAPSSPNGSTDAFDAQAVFRKISAVIGVGGVLEERIEPEAQEDAHAV